MNYKTVSDFPELAAPWRLSLLYPYFHMPVEFQPSGGRLLPRAIVLDV